MGFSHVNARLVPILNMSGRLEFVHHDVVIGSMRIGDLKPITTSVAKRAPSQGGMVSGFGSFINTEENQPAPVVHGAMPVNALGALVALQQVEDAMARRSRGLKRAESMLSELDEMHRALMLGGLPTARLQAMAGQMKQRTEGVDDPALLAVLDNIELRLAVELAKRGVSVSLSAAAH